MNLRAAAIAALALLPAACATAPVPSHAFLTSAAPFGSNQDPEAAAVAVSAWALGTTGRTRNDPILGARTAAAIDYLAGDLYASPRWEGLSPLEKQRMLQGRVEMRQALGIRPDAASQDVTDALLGVATSLSAGNAAAATADLRSPVFTLPPAQTYALLTNLPSLPVASVAANRLESDLNGGPITGCPTCQ